MEPAPQPDPTTEPDSGPVILRFPIPAVPSPEPDLSREYSRSLIVVALIGAMLMFGSWARHRNAPVFDDRVRATVRPTEAPMLSSPDSGVFASPSESEPARLSRRSDKPVEDAPAPTWTPVHKPVLTGHPIPVNRASSDELLALPGIGPVLAKRIVEERDRRAFTSVEDMRRVSGIGVKRIEQLRPLITIR